MANQLNRLSVKKVQGIAKPGRHADGGNLYLVVDKSGARRWSFLFWKNKRLREMGLGPFPEVSLSRARELAAEARTQLAASLDPISARKQAQAVPTFGEMADKYIASHSPGWRNEKHRKQWEMTLGVYAAPLRDTPVDQVDTDAVLAVLKPPWTAKPETASRLRGRIEAVLDGRKPSGCGRARTPPNGAGTLRTCWASVSASRVAITRRSPSIVCPSSWWSCGSGMASRLAPWSSAS